jgi:glycosyltransferase involved in cell wall biosynthesis
MIEGITVPPHDPEEVAGRINTLIRDPEWRRRMSEAARQ